MPMGQMPVLEVDGRRVHQSISMARYVAKRVGLSGDNEWENLIIDTAVDTVNDFRLSKYSAILSQYLSGYFFLTKKNSLPHLKSMKKSLLCHMSLMMMSRRRSILHLPQKSFHSTWKSSTKSPERMADIWL